MAELNPEQQAAVDQLLPALRRGQVSSLIGPAGSGKSFTLARLLHQIDGEALIACPTHKAAAVVRCFLDQAGVDAEVRTVASLLKLRPRLDGDGRLCYDLPRSIDSAAKGVGTPAVIVVDESSMLSSDTCADLLDLADAVGAALLLVGDAAQLPPVGDGRLAGLFLRPPGGAARLDTVMRNSGAVLALATAIRTANHPRDAWPVSSAGPPPGATGSRVIVHRRRGAWQAAAAKVICNDRWDDNPDRGPVVSWSNRAAVTLGQQLRQHRHGTAAAHQWHVGEVLQAPPWGPRRRSGAWQWDAGASLQRVPHR